MWFYVDKDRQQCGPVSVDELKRLLGTGAVTKRTHLWQEGRAEWSRLEELAPQLGIKLVAPPPTPAATMVMQAAIAPPLSMPQPAPSPPPQPIYAAPPSFAAPNQPPQMVQGYPLGTPAYPNVQAPVTRSGSGGALKGFATAFIAICVVGYYGYKNFGYLVPSIAESMAIESLNKVIDDLEPTRREIAEVYAARQLCPGEEGKNIELKASFPADVVQEIRYGTIGDHECAVVANVPKDYRLKAIAGTQILFRLRDGEWLCGMSAADKYRPKSCTKIEPN